VPGSISPDCAFMHIVHLRLYLLPLSRIHVVRSLLNMAGGTTCVIPACYTMAEMPLSWMGAEYPGCGHDVGYCVKYYRRTRADFFIQVPTRVGA
jgi:hypothetical protein